MFNQDVKSRQIYADWKSRYANTDRVTGSQTLVGESGTLTATHFTIQSMEAEDCLILTGITQNEQELDADQIKAGNLGKIAVYYPLAVNLTSYRHGECNVVK